MLKLKRKQNAIIYKDQFGNEYPDMVIVATSVVIDYANKVLTAVVKYYKDDNSLNQSPLMESTFIWDNVGRMPIDVDGNTIDWAKFMATNTDRAEWKNIIADVGRVPFDNLSAGLDISVEGFGFVQNQIGLTWKELMLFLPIHSQFSGVKFLDEVFEYANE
jgi:hypothetical protein